MEDVPVRYSLSARALAELDKYMTSEFEEELGKCALCKTAMLQVSLLFFVLHVFLVLDPCTPKMHVL